MNLYSERLNDLPEVHVAKLDEFCDSCALHSALSALHT